MESPIPTPTPAPTPAPGPTPATNRSSRRRRVNPALVMQKSIRRVQHTLGPAVFAALIILLVVIAITTIGIFLFEHGENPNAGTLFSVVNWVFLTVVTSSPWPLMTAGGKILA